MPERGNAEAVAAVLSGTVQAASPNISGAAELVWAGRLRAIAVTGAQRITGFPEGARRSVHLDTSFLD